MITSLFVRSSLAGLALLTLISPLAAADKASFADFDRRAQAGDPLSVVFFGASLTWGANASDPQLTSYRAVVADRLREKYPQARFRFWDAAIGGTGSQLGVFRLDRDVLRRKPDLVFLDFSANDDIYSDRAETLASYESLVRRIVGDEKLPLVQVIFPFKWNVASGNFDGMKRRDAHRRISSAYHTALGDAIELAQTRVKAGASSLEALWPFDGVHPGDAGYTLFADAAWMAYEQAVADKLACQAPDEMLYGPAYMKSARVRISSLAPLPEGWRVGGPNVVAAYFDMQMSRWLDDEVLAGDATKGAETKPAPKVDRLKVTFQGSAVLLFGESTPKSGKYRAFVDGQQIERTEGKEKTVVREFDAGQLGRRLSGNTHLVHVIAEGLDPTAEHELEIEPLLAAGEELRLESICVAGAQGARVSRTP